MGPHGPLPVRMYTAYRFDCSHAVSPRMRWLSTCSAFTLAAYISPRDKSSAGVTSRSEMTSLSPNSTEVLAAISVPMSTDTAVNRSSGLLRCPPIEPPLNSNVCQLLHPCIADSRHAMTATRTLGWAVLIASRIPPSVGSCRSRSRMALPLGRVDTCGRDQKDIP